VDKMLMIIGREKRTSALHHLYHLITDNRTQLEDVLYMSEFDIGSITGFEVGIDDILMLVETIFEELLPEGGLGGITHVLSKCSYQQVFICVYKKIYTYVRDRGKAMSRDLVSGG